jgi:hypothetical protein
MNEKIEKMLASQWESRLRKVDNKFVKSGSRLPSPDATQELPAEKPPKSVVLRESKLVLNEGLLDRLRSPTHLKEFYTAIQVSISYISIPAVNVFGRIFCPRFMDKKSLIKYRQKYYNFGQISILGFSPTKNHDKPVY